jgi:hypothetical protein
MFQRLLVSLSSLILIFSFEGAVAKSTIIDTTNAYPWPLYRACYQDSLPDGIYYSIVSFRRGVPVAEIPKSSTLANDPETDLLRARFASGSLKGQLMSLGKYCVIQGKPYYGVGFNYVPMHRDGNGFYLRAKRGRATPQDIELQNQMRLYRALFFPVAVNIAIGVISTSIDMARTQEERDVRETLQSKPVATSQKSTDSASIARFILDLRTGDLVPEPDWDRHLEEIRLRPQPSIAVYSAKKSFPSTRLYLVSDSDTLFLFLKGKSKVSIPLTRQFEEFTLSGPGLDPIRHFPKAGTEFFQATRSNGRLALEEMDEKVGVKQWRKVPDIVLVAP